MIPNTSRHGSRDPRSARDLVSRRHGCAGRDHYTPLVLSTNRGCRWTLVPVERTTLVCDVTWATVEQGWNSPKAVAGGTKRHPSSLLARPGGVGRSPPSQDLSQRKPHGTHQQRPEPERSGSEP